MKKIALLIICTATGYSTFAIDPITGPTSVCEGSNITLTDATSGGTWSTSAAATGTISTGGVLTGIAAGVVTVTYTVGGPYVTMDVTVNPTGTLVSTLSPPAICDNTLFSYVPTLSAPGATLNWSRAVVPNISSPAGSGSGAVAEVLHNTASFPVAVAYVFTVTTGACTSTSTVTVNVNPTPRLSNPLPPDPICDSALFAFFPASATVGTSYSWVRLFVVGIPMLAAAGSGNISEVLDNATTTLLTVTYVYTLTANGCSNTQNVLLTVNPTPHLSSPQEDTVCSGKSFIYLPESDVYAPVAYKWVRPAVAGITNPTATLVGPINETLINSTAGPVYVPYTGTLTLTPGCTNTQDILVRVEAEADCETGVSEQRGSRVFSIFPNPASGQFYVSYHPAGSGNATLAITDVVGRTILSTAMIPGEQRLSIRRSGIYAVKVTDSNGDVYAGRLVIE